MVCILIGIRFYGQEHLSENIRILGTYDSLRSPEQMIRARLSQELDYFLSMSAFQFLNWNHDTKTNHMIFLQSLKYRLLICKDSSFCFSSILLHELGFQFFVDSITQIDPDETTLATRLSVNLHKRLNITFVSDISTGLLNNIDYISDDHGKPLRVLSSSFLTPLTTTFSFGLGHSLPGFGDLNIGLSSAKFTCIRDRSIFDKLNVSDYYGIPKGKNHHFEYGFSLRVLIDKDLFKNVHWSCDLFLFKNYLSPVDISLKNLFCIRLSRFIKTSIQTKILFEEKTSKNLQMENHINIGFSIHL